MCRDQTSATPPRVGDDAPGSKIASDNLAGFRALLAEEWRRARR
jgi:hypothetical protein